MKLGWRAGSMQSQKQGSLERQHLPSSSPRLKRGLFDMPKTFIFKRLFLLLFFPSLSDAEWPCRVGLLRVNRSFPGQIRLYTVGCACTLPVAMHVILANGCVHLSLAVEVAETSLGDFRLIFVSRYTSQYQNARFCTC